jgi:hypothetical protein
MRSRGRPPTRLVQVRTLADLELTTVERAALARQGSVTAEKRGASRYYKLRFRVEGRQQVRYLGKDISVAKAIARELQGWQTSRQLRVDLGRLAKRARARLRAARAQLAPLLEQDGLWFHGFTLRHRRARKPGALDRKDYE